MNISCQNRTLKGNVSIMVILILLACSLMGILTVVFLKSLITYTDDTYSYHKSYYIGKAGLELALTEIDNSSMGFSQDINSGDFINSNFNCAGCNFTLHIQGRDNLISNNFWQSDECNEETALVLQPGQSMTIPMFYDNAGEFAQIFSDQYTITRLGSSRKDLNLKCLNNSCPSQELNIGAIFQEWNPNLTGDLSREYLYMTGIYMDTTNFFYNYFESFDDVNNDYKLVWDNQSYIPYLIISNPDTQQKDAKFCIYNDKSQWPTTKYFISSVGEYMGKTVGLQAIYAQPTPSFFINPYSN